MNSRLMLASLAAVVVLNASSTPTGLAENAVLGATLLTAESTPSPLLGSGHGVDHVGVAVRDLSVARSVYANLGFTVDPGGKHPSGTENLPVDFVDDTYIELLGIYDREKASKAKPSFVRFLDQHEGSLFLGLDVSSANETANYLRSRNIEIAGPTRGTISSPGIQEPETGLVVS